MILRSFLPFAGRGATGRAKKETPKSRYGRGFRRFGFGKGNKNYRLIFLARRAPTAAPAITIRIKMSGAISSMRSADGTAIASRDYFLT